MRQNFHWFGAVMHRALFGTLAASMLLAIGACAPKSAPEAPVITFQQQQEGGLRTQWQYSIGLAPGEKVIHLWRVGDALYAYTSQCQLHSLNAASGTKNWSLDFGPIQTDIFAPIEMGDNKPLMVVSRSTVYYVDKVHGVFVNRAKLADAAASQPVITGENLLYGSAGYLYGTYVIDPGSRDWTIRAADDIFIAPLLKVDNSHVVAVTHNGYVRAIQPSNGLEHWAIRKVNGKVTVQPGLSPDKKVLVVVADDKKAYAFGYHNGNELWDARLNGTLNQSPVFAGGKVLVACQGEGLFALNQEIGTTTWKTPGISQVVTVNDEEVIVVTDAGDLARIKTDTGAIIATTHLSGSGGIFLTSTTEQTVYLSTQDGKLAAIVRE